MYLRFSFKYEKLSEKKAQITMQNTNLTIVWHIFRMLSECFLFDFVLWTEWTVKYAYSQQTHLN